ncbi:hypothetical protein [Halomicrococcus gelatinilyticus]
MATETETDYDTGTESGTRILTNETRERLPGRWLSVVAGALLVSS